MIKFFRRIRQNLLTENKFSKYFLYAIGEIILVVIGILIALQINNWNENQKLKAEEIKMLQNFKSSIAADTVGFNWHIKYFDFIDTSVFILLQHLEEDLPHHDRLNYHFTQSTAVWMPRIDQEVFASLASTDLNIISNDTLKKELISYYSFAKRRFDIFINRYSNIMEDASKNIFATRFNALWNSTWDDQNKRYSKGWMIPNDYEALKKDKEYLYFLKSLKNQVYWYVRSPLADAKRRADNLLNSLDEDLKALEND